MDFDGAVAARATGKSAVAARTVWELNAGRYRYRCVAQAKHNHGPFRLEMRTERWHFISEGENAEKMLDQLLRSKLLRKTIALRARYALTSAREK